MERGVGECKMQESNVVELYAITGLQATIIIRGAVNIEIIYTENKELIIFSRRDMRAL